MALERPPSGWDALIARALEELFTQDSVGALERPLPLRGEAEGIGRAIARYLDELSFWNQRVQLTAARSAQELVELAVADAAILAAATDPFGAETPRSWVDVGSGNGAPGIPLAVLGARPMTLVEPRQKRVAFLRSVVGKLGLGEVEVVRARSDALRERGWDLAVSRATLSPSSWLAEGARLAREVWVLLAREEPPRLEGWAVARDIAYRLPLSGAPRRAVCYAPMDS